MPNRVALLRAEIEAAHPGAQIRHRGEAGFSMRLPDGRSEHRYTTGPLHWRQPEADDWVEVDTDLEDRADPTWKHGVKSARFDTVCTDDGRRRFYPRRWIPSEYVEFGPLEYLGPGNKWRVLPVGKLTRIASRLIGEDLADSQFLLGSTGQGGGISLTLKSDKLTRPVRWSVTLAGLTWQDGALLSGAEQVGRIYPPSWSDVNHRSVPIPWAYQGGYLTLTPDFTDAVFPVEVDPDYTIADGANDGWADNTSDFNSTAARIILGTEGGTGTRNGWLRFTGIAANSGDTCLSATILFESSATDTSDGELVKTAIWCLDEDDTVAPASWANWSTDHGLHDGEAQTDWDFTATAANGTDLTTSDFAAHVTHVLARANWETGDPLGVHVDNDSSDVAHYQAVFAYENLNELNPPILSLTVEAGGAAAEVSLPLLSPAVLYAPSVEPTVTLPLISAASIFEPTLVGEGMVTLPLLSPVGLYGPALQPSATLPLLAPTSLYGPSVQPSVTLPLLAPTSLYGPALQPSITLPLLAPTTLHSLQVGAAGTTTARISLQPLWAGTGTFLLKVRALNTQDAGTLYLDLYDGDTLVADFEQALTDTFTTYTFDWSTEGAAHSTWTDPELRVWGDGAGQFQISAVWLFLPPMAVTLPLLSALTMLEPTVSRYVTEPWNIVAYVEPEWTVTVHVDQNRQVAAHVETAATMNVER